jgi:hypothetical protein
MKRLRKGLQSSFCVINPSIIVLIGFMVYSVIYKFSNFTKSHLVNADALQNPLGNILVTLTPQSRPMPHGFFCFNAESVRIKSWSNPAFITAVRSLSPQSLRIPGGDESNYWDWQRGGLIQDIEALPDGLPFFLRYGERDYIASKLKNFNAGFKAIKTRPTVVLNMLTSSLDSQIQMLREAKNLGLLIQDIELGNEFYFGTGNYRSVFPQPEDYAQSAVEWTSRIKSEFPKTKVSVVGVADEEHAYDPRYSQWNHLVFPKTLKVADAVSLHLYPEHGLGPEEQSKYLDYPFFADSDVPLILGEPFRIWEQIRKTEPFRTIPSNRKIWITEYNLLEIIFDQPENLRPRVMGSWVHGLYTLQLSLLFLEEFRVQKICNHALIGNSLFSAIYRDRKSFVNPVGQTITTTPFGLSATGSTLKLLGTAIQHSVKAQRMNFADSPILLGKDRFQYPALYGWLFSNRNKTQKAIILNLSPQVVSVDLTTISLGEMTFTQLSAHPRTLVNSTRQLHKTVGAAIGSVTLPSYSVTLLTSTQP